VIGVHLLSRGHTGHGSIFHAISQKKYSHRLDASKISWRRSRRLAARAPEAS
jgi:hypothetical protein